MHHVATMDIELDKVFPARGNVYRAKRQWADIDWVWGPCCGWTRSWNQSWSWHASTERHGKTISVNHVNNKYFQLGRIVCLEFELCKPCSYIEQHLK